MKQLYQFAFIFCTFIALSFFLPNSSIEAQGTIDLIVTKTNNVGGLASVGNSWIWDVRLTNNGTADIDYTSNVVMLVDNLPSGLSYSNLTLTSAGGASGSTFPSCSLSSGTVTCNSNGSYLMFSANNNGGDPGYIGFQITVTPSAQGTFTNPQTGQDCLADPNNNIAENNEANNACSDTVNVVGPPNLVVNKTNNVGGNVALGSDWFWDMTVSNIGASAASFNHLEVIFRDQLPTANISYVNSAITSTGVAGTIFCNLTVNVVVCTANGTVTISAGGNFVAQVRATPTAGGTYTNPRSGGVCAVDPNNNVVESSNSDNSCSNSVTVIQPDLTATKSNDTTGNTVTLDDNFTWTVRVANTGADDANFVATNVLLRDNLPNTGATYGAPSITNVTGIPNSGNISCSITTSDLVCSATGNVDIAGSTGRFDVTIPVTATAVQTLANPRSAGTCSVDPDNNIVESNESNNACSDSVTVLQSDLTATKSNDTISNSVLLGDSFNWTIQIANRDTGDARFVAADVLLRDNLPNTGATYGAPSITNVTGIPNSGNISCSITASDLVCSATGNVDIAGSTGRFDVVIPVTAIAAQTLANPRSAGTCSADPDANLSESNESNNSCSNTVTVLQPNLTVTKQNDTAGTARLNNSFIWSFTIDNIDGGDATFLNGDVIFSDDLPSTATYGSVLMSSSSNIINSANIDCSITTLVLTCVANGADVIFMGNTARLIFTVNVTATTLGTLRNPEAGGACIVDPNNTIAESDETNNACSNTVQVIEGDPVQEASDNNGLSIADPAISKIGFLVPGQVGVTGERLEWIVTVTNQDTDPISNLVIVDDVDTRLSVTSVSANGATSNINGQVVTVTYATIGAGETVQFSIFTDVLDGVQVTNTACIDNSNICATGSVIGELPNTGETPFLRQIILMMGLIVISSLTGMSLFRRKQV